MFSDSILIPLLEACSRVSPQINLDPVDIHTFIKISKVWHLIIPLLEAGFLRNPDNELYFITLSNLYNEIRDKDHLTALHRIVSSVK